MNYFTEAVLRTLEHNLTTDKRLDSLERLTKKVTDTGRNIKSLLTDIDINEIREENTNFSKGLIKVMNDFEKDHEIDDRDLSLACHHVLHDEYDIRKVITLSEKPDFTGLEDYCKEFKDSFIAHYKHPIFDAKIKKLWIKQNINPGDNVSLYLKKDFIIGGIDMNKAISYIGTIDLEKDSEKNIEKSTIVNLESGIHARPSSIICEMANSYDNDIFIRNVTKNEEGNAKSILNLIALCITEGEEVLVRGKYETPYQKNKCIETINNMISYINDTKK